MPQYTVTLDVNGKPMQMTVEADQPPTPEAVLATLRAQQSTPRGPAGPTPWQRAVETVQALPVPDGVWPALQKSVGSTMGMAPTTSDQVVTPELVRSGLATGLSTATSLTGLALGGVPGEMLGNYAGRKLNVALGLEDPGTAGDVAAVALPGVFGAGRWAKRAWRGEMTPAARELQTLSEQHQVPLTYGETSGSPFAKRTETTLEQVPLVGTGRFRTGQAAAAKTAAQTETDTLYQQMLQTPYRNVAEVQAAAAQGNKTAQALLGEIQLAGDDWTRIVQTSGQLKEFRTKLAADRLYARVEQAADGLGNVALKETMPTLQAAIDAVDAAKLPDNGTLKILTTMRDHLTPPTPKTVTSPIVGARGQPITTQVPHPIDNSFGALRALRSDLDDEITRLTSRGDLKSARHLNAVRQAVDRDLETFAVTSPVPELRDAWRRADTFYKEQVVPYHNRQLANALKDAHPDEVYGKFMQRGKADRAQSFYDALDPKGQAAVRYGMVDEALEKALNPTTEAFSPARFVGELDRLQAAYGVVFKGQARWELDGFKKLLRASERAGQYMENPPNGQRLINMMFGGAVVGGVLTHPEATAIGGGVATLASWLLTSPTGKRLLLAASDATPGSPAMHRVMQTLEREWLRVQATTAETPAQTSSPAASR